MNTSEYMNFEWVQSISDIPEVKFFLWRQVAWYLVWSAVFGWVYANGWSKSLTEKRKLNMDVFGMNFFTILLGLALILPTIESTGMV